MSAAAFELTPAAESGFAPLADPAAHTLVLGSLPSRRSLELKQYYGNPRNAFWRIMGELLGAGPELPYPLRVERLTGAGIAVWDVLARSVRPGSMDADIDMASAVPNDFERFFRDFRAVRRVFFNGRTAAAAFERFGCRPRTRDLDLHTLPSTSPAYAAMPFADKLARWRVVAQSPAASGMVTSEPSRPPQRR